MKTIIVLLAMLLPASTAFAGTSCTTRKSGSVTITSCSDSKARGSTTSRSYRSGSVIKTSCN